VVLLVASALLLSDSFAQKENAEPPVRIPSDVAWTGETLATIAKGDAFRGLLLARRCNHCHGEEGFSTVPGFPNLAGEDRLSFWKQMQDFRSGKRTSPVMQAIAEGYSARDAADLAAYYAMLPTASDALDKRAFPQAMTDPSRATMAIRLIVFGDGQRGIPPCQSCHGPVSYVQGAPPLASQNGEHLEQQLEHFSNGNRANDINVRMRSIARQLTAEEKTAVSEYYGAGLGPGMSSR
jgi:cytochrome c553